MFVCVCDNLQLREHAGEKTHTSAGKPSLCVHPAPREVSGVVPTESCLVGFRTEFVGLKGSHPCLATYFLVVGAHVV